MSTAPVKSISGGGEIPDYAAFCPAYWEGCFSCPDFLRDRVRFCRKWNRTFNRVDAVELEVVEEEEKFYPYPKKIMQKNTDRNWWTYGRSGK